MDFMDVADLQYGSQKKITLAFTSFENYHDTQIKTLQRK